MAFHFNKSLRISSVIHEQPGLNKLFSSPSPSPERGHSLHPLPHLPGGGRLESGGFDGPRQGPSSQAGGRGCCRRVRPPQTLSQAYECHRKVTQGHPGAGGHGKVLCEGETRNKHVNMFQEPAVGSLAQHKDGIHSHIIFLFNLDKNTVLKR